MHVHMYFEYFGGGKPKDMLTKFNWNYNQFLVNN